MALMAGDPSISGGGIDMASNSYNFNQPFGSGTANVSGGSAENDEYEQRVRVKSYCFIFFFEITILKRTT